MDAQDGGRKRAKREVIDVPEKKPEDKRLDQLLHVRKQRLSRLERERNETRAAWQEKRLSLRSGKERWRATREDAKAQWQQSRANFLAMTTSSGQFQKAKAVYERMKQEAAQLYLGCHEELARCRQAREDFFLARNRVLEANRQQEKLSILRDEIRLLNQQSEN